MTRRPSPQAQAKRLVAMLKSVGERPSSVEIKPDGTVSVLLASDEGGKPLSDLDRWRAKRGHRAA